MGGGVTLDVLNRRTSLLDQFELSRRQLDTAATDVIGDFCQKALRLVMSSETRKALNIQSESTSLRDRYGRHLFGQSCLMARRLEELGVLLTLCIQAFDAQIFELDSHPLVVDLQTNGAIVESTVLSIVGKLGG